MSCPLLALTLLLAPAGDGMESFVPENDASNFWISADLDKSDRIYFEGDAMTIRFRAERPCFAYVINVDVSGKSTILFPNKYQTDNFVRPAEDGVVEIPNRDSNVRFRARAPFGEELIIVLGTTKKLEACEQLKPTQNVATPLAKQDEMRICDKLRTDPPGRWARAVIQVRTLARGSPPPSKKRLAVCVGISQYRHDRIRDLRVADRDAATIARAFESFCGVSDVRILQNEKATRAAIRQAIFEDLPNRTRPGDTVFLYFSCHGGGCNDKDGDEQDGIDEYLVPHDGVFGDPKTMILDDTFASWMQALDGREVIVILDNCYSGGSSKGLGGSDTEGKVTVDYFDSELRRWNQLTKELTQPRTVILTASQADQRAWEMTDTDSSVLTYHLVRALQEKTTDANGDGAITTGELYGVIKTPIQRYVQKHFGVEQVPALFDNAGGATVFASKN